MPNPEIEAFVVLADKAADNALGVIEEMREQLRCAAAQKSILMDRICKTDAALAAAHKELGDYSRYCSELTRKLAEEFLVESPDLKAMLLVLDELRRAKFKHPHLAINEEEALVVLASEFGELSTAILRRDVHGPHGMIREAAQVAAVAIRIIEYCMLPQEERTCGNCGNDNDSFLCAAGHDCEGGRSNCQDWTPKEDASRV